MSILEKGNFIRNAVINHDVSKVTINTIFRFLDDKERMPITKAPICYLAEAALDVLNIKTYTGTEEDVLYYREMFTNDFKGLNK